ncbi:MAG: haloacid dehalogenase [Gammaproteobacteria bacterium]|jgi:2-haloacid dehalogenase|nr:MAG: haloacid dehalogenase [Gammaproteobacteria bacterium]
MSDSKQDKQGTKLEKKNYKTLSFDCYGTLIDWENGILGYLQPLFESVDVHVIDSWVMETFAELEPVAQAEGGSYRSVLSGVLEQFATRLAFSPSEEVLAGFAGSIEYWQPFPDTVAGLAELKKDFKLIALSNIDDELFRQSAQLMSNPFDALISAEQVGAYKPDPRMFEALLDQAEGPILHVAQSRYHDIVPATTAGLDTVWINRPTIGAAKPADASPTWTFDSLAEFTAAWN